MTGELQWAQRGSAWALWRSNPLLDSREIIQYVRWSDAAEQYVDMRGVALGTDLEAAKRQVEAKA